MEFKIILKTRYLFDISTLQEEDGSKVRIYSVHASPVEDHFIISAGNDQFVRLYDRRNMAGTVKKFCPSHLVRFFRNIGTYLYYFLA